MNYGRITPLKTNMDTRDDGLEKVTPFKNGKFWYLFQDASHHQDSSIFSRESQPKPLFVTGILCGG